MFLSLSSTLIRWKLNPPSISTDALQEKLTSGDDDPICLLDVRDEAEFQVSHLAGGDVFPVEAGRTSMTAFASFIQQAEPVDN